MSLRCRGPILGRQRPAGWLLLAMGFLLQFGVGAASPGSVVVPTAFDLTGFLASHPLMLRFDRATRRFADTPSAFLGPAGLASAQAALRTLEERLTVLQSTGQRLVCEQLGPGRLAEEAFWGELARHRRDAMACDREKRRLAYVCEKQGVTSPESIRPQVAAIVADLRARLAGQPGLVLNHLPPAAAYRLDRLPGQNPWRLALVFGDDRWLASYLEGAYGLTWLLPRLRRPVVWSVESDRPGRERGR